ncbi:MAG: hypothetical protein MJZ92_03585, partial [Paludibacteraceae bacterium]|nr:hypothetical protein [Paludibacteraceae bacterium]
MTITDGYDNYDSYGGPLKFTIGSPATYRIVSVVSNNTTMGTVSYTYKSGYVYADNRSQEFKEGSVYTLTATPKAGYRFVSWSDGKAQTHDVTINGNATYTATFALDVSEATITRSAGVGGTVGGDAGKYSTNTQHTITATANSGYGFAYWEDANHNIVSNNASYTFTLMADVNYTAIFYADGTITANSNNTDWGTVTGGGSYKGNQQVTLTATPKGGYQFVEWNDHNTDATRQVVVNGNATYTATFAVETASYASFSWDDANDIIETEAYTEGALCGSMFYPYGSKFIWIQAKNKARSTHNFLNLVIRTNNSRKYHNDEYDGPLVADYSVVVPTEYGPVVANCDNSIYESNYYFCQLPGNVTDKVVGWHIETMSHGGTCHFQGYFGTLSQRISMLCSFACDKTNVNSDIGENESNYTNINSAIVKVSEGKDGHMYIRIENASTGKLLITIGEPASTTPIVTINTPTNGTIVVKDANNNTITSGTQVEKGTVLTVTATPSTDYLLSAWTGGITTTSTEGNVVTGTITVDNSVTIGATFAACIKYTIEINPNSGSGLITITDANTGVVYYNDHVTKDIFFPTGCYVSIVGKPDAGSKVKFSYFGGDNYYTTEHTFTSSFQITASNRWTIELIALSPTVTITKPTDGTIVVTDANGQTITSGTQVEKGTVLNVKLTTEKNYVWSQWIGCTIDNTQMSLELSNDKHAPTGKNIYQGSFTVDNDVTIGAGLNGASNVFFGKAKGKLPGDGTWMLKDMNDNILYQGASSGTVTLATDAKLKWSIMPNDTSYTQVQKKNEDSTIKILPSFTDSIFVMPSANCSLYMYFMVKPRIKMEAMEHGSVIVKNQKNETLSDGDYFAPGDVLTLTAVPADGYKFEGWNSYLADKVQNNIYTHPFAKGTDTDASLKVANIGATFAPNVHTLTWAGIDGATLSGDYTAAGQVAYGTALVAPTVEKAGYNFTGWSPSVAATMPDNDVTYTAQW